MAWPIPLDPAGSPGRIDWSKEPGVQTKQPAAPEAVRVAYLLEEIADEFRAIKAAAADDGKDDVLAATKCKLELGVSWTTDGEASIKFWVLEVGGGASREAAQKVTVEMTLLPAVPLIARSAGGAGGIDGADAISWSHEETVMDRKSLTDKDGGSLRLAFMLEKLADELRYARAGAAGKEAILHYDKVTLELTGTTIVNAKGGVKFLVFDLAAGGSHERAQSITVEMEPLSLGEIVAGGVVFAH